MRVQRDHRRTIRTNGLGKLATNFVAGPLPNLMACALVGQVGRRALEPSLIGRKRLEFLERFGLGLHDLWHD